VTILTWKDPVKYVFLFPNGIAGQWWVKLGSVWIVTSLRKICAYLVEVSRGPIFFSNPLPQATCDRRVHSNHEWIPLIKVRSFRGWLLELIYGAAGAAGQTGPGCAGQPRAGPGPCRDQTRFLPFMKSILPAVVMLSFGRYGALFPDAAPPPCGHAVHAAKPRGFITALVDSLHFKITCFWADSFQKVTANVLA